jgi:hypothetical protein
MTLSNGATPTATESLPAAIDPEAVIAQVQKWILAGAADRDVAEAIAAAWPGTESRPAIAAAIERIAESANFSQALVAGFCLEATRELYRRMLEIGDFSGALKAIKQLSDFAQRFAPREETNVCDQDASEIAEPPKRRRRKEKD